MNNCIKQNLNSKKKLRIWIIGLNKKEKYGSKTNKKIGNKEKG